MSSIISQINGNLYIGANNAPNFNQGSRIIYLDDSVIPVSAPTTGLYVYSNSDKLEIRNNLGKKTIIDASTVTVVAKTVSLLSNYINSNGSVINGTGVMPIIDGIVINNNDLILVDVNAGLSTNAHCGIYQLTTSTPNYQLTRAATANSSELLSKGLQITVTEGVTEGASIWIHSTLSTTSADIIFNTTPLTFTKISGGGGGGGSTGSFTFGTGTITSSVGANIITSGNSNIILSPDGTGITTTAKNLISTSVTNSTSTTTGSITTTGGIGVLLDQYLGGNLNIGGNILGTNLNTDISILPNGTGRLLLNGFPVLDNHAVTKMYVDGLINGLTPKLAVKVKTTISDLTTLLSTSVSVGAGAGKYIESSANASLPTIDSVTMVLNDRILLVDSSPNLNYGIYTVTNLGDGSTKWRLTRSTDCDNSPVGEVVAGIYAFITSGSVHANQSWTLINTPVTLDTTPLIWSQSSGGISLTPSFTNVSTSNITIAVDDPQSISTSSGDLTLRSFGSNAINLIPGATGVINVGVEAFGNINIGGSTSLITTITGSTTRLQSIGNIIITPGPGNNVQNVLNTGLFNVTVTSGQINLNPTSTGTVNINTASGTGATTIGSITPSSGSTILYGSNVTISPAIHGLIDLTSSGTGQINVNPTGSGAVNINTSTGTGPTNIGSNVITAGSTAISGSTVAITPAINGLIDLVSSGSGIINVNPTGSGGVNVNASTGTGPTVIGSTTTGNTTVSGSNVAINPAAGGFINLQSNGTGAININPTGSGSVNINTLLTSIGMTNIGSFTTGTTTVSGSNVAINPVSDGLIDLVSSGTGIINVNPTGSGGVNVNTSTGTGATNISGTNIQITSKTNGNISIIPNGIGDTIIGNTTGDLLLSGIISPVTSNQLIIYNSTAKTVGSLVTGNSGNILTTDGTVVSWTSPAVSQWKYASLTFGNTLTYNELAVGVSANTNFLFNPSTNVGPTDYSSYTGSSLFFDGSTNRVGAFRAGTVTGTTFWNDANRGKASAAFGTDCIAAGENSFAIGNLNSITSLGTNSFVTGLINTITTFSSSIIGGTNNSITNLVGGYNTIIGGENNTITSVADTPSAVNRRSSTIMSSAFCTMTNVYNTSILSCTNVQIVANHAISQQGNNAIICTLAALGSTDVMKGDTSNVIQSLIASSTIPVITSTSAWMVGTENCTILSSSGFLKIGDNQVANNFIAAAFGGPDVSSLIHITRSWGNAIIATRITNSTESILITSNAAAYNNAIIACSTGIAGSILITGAVTSSAIIASSGGTIDGTVDCSFAGGFKPFITHTGSFVWGGNGTSTTNSVGDGSFVARAPGGFRVYTATSGTTTSFSSSSTNTSINGITTEVGTSATTINIGIETASLNMIGVLPTGTNNGILTYNSTNRTINGLITGTNGQVLTSNGTTFSWVTPPTVVSSHWKYAALLGTGNTLTYNELSAGTSANTNFLFTPATNVAAVDLNTYTGSLVFFDGSSARAGAFRAGTVSGTSFWNDANRGIASVAFGTDCIASGANSFAMGATNTVASSLSSILGGTNNRITNFISSAIIASNGVVMDNVGTTNNTCVILSTVGDTTNMLGTGGGTVISRCSILSSTYSSVSSNPWIFGGTNHTIISARGYISIGQTGISSNQNSIISSSGGTKNSGIMEIRSGNNNVILGSEVSQLSSTITINGTSAKTNSIISCDTVLSSTNISGDSKSCAIIASSGAQIIGNTSYCFIGGQYPRISGDHEGSFVWGGNGTGITDSIASGSFVARTPGGFRILNKTSGNLTTFDSTTTNTNIDGNNINIGLGDNSILLGSTITIGSDQNITISGVEVFINNTRARFGTGSNTGTNTYSFGTNTVSGSFNYSLSNSSTIESNNSGIFAGTTNQILTTIISRSVIIGGNQNTITSAPGLARDFSCIYGSELCKITSATLSSIISSRNINIVGSNNGTDRYVVIASSSPNSTDEIIKNSRGNNTLIASSVTPAIGAVSPWVTGGNQNTILSSSGFLNIGDANNDTDNNLIVAVQGGPDSSSLIQLNRSKRTVILASSVTNTTEFIRSLSSGATDNAIIACRTGISRNIEIIGTVKSSAIIASSGAIIDGAVDCSFAGGFMPSITHTCSFVWGGNGTVATSSIGAGSFIARAPGGFRVYTTTTDTTASFSSSSANTSINGTITEVGTSATTINIGIATASLNMIGVLPTGTNNGILTYNSTNRTINGLITGTNGQVLTSNGTTFSWATPGGGSLDALTDAYVLPASGIIVLGNVALPTAVNTTIISPTYSGSLTGVANTIIGPLSGNAITTGTNNTIIGASSGNILTTGSSNIIHGNNAASTLTTGSNNIIIGRNSNVSSAAANNRLVIGNNVSATVDNGLFVPSTLSEISSGTILGITSSGQIGPVNPSSELIMPVTHNFYINDLSKTLIRQDIVNVQRKPSYISDSSNLSYVKFYNQIIADSNQTNLSFGTSSLYKSDKLYIFAGTRNIAAAATTGTSLAVSQNGIRYNKININTTKVYDVAYNGTMYVVIYNSSPSAFNLSYGVDLTRLTNIQLLSGAALRSIYWDGTKFIVGSETTNSSYSYDGIVWTNFTSGFPLGIVKIVYNGSIYVAIGNDSPSNGNTIRNSSNGIVWNPVTNLITNTFIDTAHDLIWTGRLFVAAGTGSTIIQRNTICISKNGITWTGIRNVFNLSCRNLAFNGNIIVAAGYAAGVSGGIQSSVYSSTDGYNWSPGSYASQTIDVSSRFTLIPFPNISTTFTAYKTDKIVKIVMSGINTSGLPASIIIGSYGFAFLNSGVDDLYPDRTVYKSTGITYRFLTVENGGVLSPGGIVNAFNAVAADGTVNANTTSTSGLYVERNVSGISASWDRRFLNNSIIDVPVGGSVNLIFEYVTEYSGLADPTTTANYVSNLIWDSNKFILSYLITSGSIANSATILNSYDGVKWERTINNTTNLHLDNDQTTPTKVIIPYKKPHTITFNKELLVMGAFPGANCAMYSEDSGVTWIPFGGTTFTIAMTYALFTGSIWVYSGVGTNTLGFSDTGKNIKVLGANIFTSICNYLATNGNIIVGFGSGTNSLAYSYNGIVWFGVGVTIFTNSRGGCWFKDKFLAAGQGANTLAYSFDGITWVGLGNTTFNSFGINISCNEHIAIACGEGNAGNLNIAYSFDGINWQLVNQILFTTGAVQVAWNGNVWVAVGTGTNTSAYSYDGITWVAGGNQFGGATSGIHIYWSGTRFYASVNAARVHTSIDGINWTSNVVAGVTFTYGMSSSNPSKGYIKIQHPTLVFGEGTVNTMGYSLDGLNYIGLGNTIFSIRGRTGHWNGKMWVVGGEGTNTMAYSFNGKNFIGLGTSIFTISCNGIAYSPQLSRWVAVGTGGGNNVAYSTDGINWIGLIVPGFSIGYTVIYAKGTFILGGNGAVDQSIYYSTNGINWFIPNNCPLTSVFSITYGVNRFVAVGAGGNRIAYSTNILDWTSIASTGMFAGGAQIGYGVIFMYKPSNGINTGLPVFIAVGDGGSAGNNIVGSTDGVVWSTNIWLNGCSTRIRSIGYNGLRSIYTGSGGHTLGIQSIQNANLTALSENLFSVEGYGVCTNSPYATTVFPNALEIGNNESLVIQADDSYDSSIVSAISGAFKEI